MSEISYYTPEGLENLKQEIKHLETVERPKISQQIAEARDKGDLSENAEYDAAKEAQGMLEARISKLKNTFANARLIDDSEIDNIVSRRKAKGTFGVVDAKEVKHGGVKVVDLHLVFDGFVSPFVGRTVGDSGVYATAREPGGEAEGVVVAAVSSLSERGTPEFAGPDEEGFLEEAEFF